MIANPGSGPSEPLGAQSGAGGGAGRLCFPKTRGRGIFDFKTPGFSGGFLKDFCPKNGKSEAKFSHFQQKNYLKILIWPRLQQIFRGHQKFYLNLFSDQIDLILGVIFWEKLWNNSDIMHPPPPGPPVRGQNSKGRGPRGRGIYVPNFPRGPGVGGFF